MFHLITDHPIAVNSYDYQYPQGTALDNNRSEAFNKVFRVLSGSVLDLGCAGGGFIKDCLDQGRIAVGLEGSNYCKKFGKYEWPALPNNLFTCDITQPFALYCQEDEIPFKFDVITMWEVFEHIDMKDIGQVFANIDAHLKSGGFIVATISKGHSFHPLYREVDLHRTRRGRDWWTRQFTERGFYEEAAIEQAFGNNWLRYSRTNHKFVFRKYDNRFDSCPLAQ